MSNLFTNMLAGWQWLILAAIPPLIVLLYFLKLRRQPVEVPSTYLWTRTIEDLHVNSIWQRLRQNLLLFLQLLLLLLIILACLRPGWQGTALVGNRFIFLVDASASMSATDVRPTRLDAAKEKIVAMIDQMKSGDAAMVISFSNNAKVEQPFTDNRRLLRERVNQIAPTNRTSDLSEALRAAAGLANPGRTSQSETNEAQVADAMPSTLYILSDGGFAKVPDFSLGNLEPQYLKVGEDRPRNVAIAAFSVGRNPDRPTQQQAFGRLENFGPDPVSVEVTLHRDARLIDATKIDLPAAEFSTDPATQNTACAPGAAGVEFDLGQLDEGLLKLEIVQADALDVDNVAYAALQTPRRAKVLLITSGNEALRLAMLTDEAQKISELSLAEPSVLETKAFADEAAQGQYDLIIFDRCAPQKMPASNTLFIDAKPPSDDWEFGKRQGNPGIIDTDRAHPLLQLVEFGNVHISNGHKLKPPPGGSVLIDSVIGPLMAIAPRGGYEDAVLGFAIIETNEQGEKLVNSDWFVRLSFPVFCKNVLEYLGGNAGAPTLPSIQPGTPMILRAQTPVARITVTTPSGQKIDLSRENQGSFVFATTNELGIYDVLEGTANQTSQRFAVNLFSSRESDLHPAEKVTLGYEAVPGVAGVERSRKELWKWLLIGGLGVLIFEWYVYNRRVYF